MYGPSHGGSSFDVGVHGKEVIPGEAFPWRLQLPMGLLEVEHKVARLE
jgi:hypothetical protein